ncbi:MAG: universal stress protein [Halodesulfurarchaeum sp.]
MYRLLVPLDDDPEQARTQAEYAISQPGAQADILVILTHPFIGEQEALSEAEDTESVRRATALLDEAGLSYEQRRLSSPPPDGILDLVESEDIDEVVMAGRKRSPVMKAVLGDTTQTVILNSKIPVTVTGGS